MNGRASVDVVRTLGAIRIEETGTELKAVGSERYSVLRDDPATARSEAVREAGFRRDDWNARLVSRSAVEATADGWRLDAHLEAFDDDRSIFARRWTIETPRAG